MRESDFIDRVSDRTGHPKSEVKRTLQAIIGEIIECVAHGDSIAFGNFGSFHSKDLPKRSRSSRRDRKTGRFVLSLANRVEQLPARRVPHFRSSRAFRKQCQDTAERLGHL